MDVTSSFSAEVANCWSLNQPSTGSTAAAPEWQQLLPSEHSEPPMFVGVGSAASPQLHSWIPAETAFPQQYGPPHFEDYSTLVQLGTADSSWAASWQLPQGVLSSQAYQEYGTGAGMQNAAGWTANAPFLYPQFSGPPPSTYTYTTTAWEPQFQLTS